MAQCCRGWCSRQSCPNNNNKSADKWIPLQIKTTYCSCRDLGPHSCSAPPNWCCDLMARSRATFSRVDLIDYWLNRWTIAAFIPPVLSPRSSSPLVGCNSEQRVNRSIGYQDETGQFESVWWGRAVFQVPRPPPLPPLPIRFSWKIINNKKFARKVPKLLAIIAMEVQDYSCPIKLSMELKAESQQKERKKERTKERKKLEESRIFEYSSLVRTKNNKYQVECEISLWRRRRRRRRKRCMELTRWI